MNAALTTNWNTVVSPSDTVIHVGDFAFGNKDLIPGLRARLNGEIILILGNHDIHRKTGQVLTQIKDAGFKEIHEELYMTVDGTKLYIRHEPKMTWTPGHDAEYHIAGHVHESFTRKGSILNCGVDVNNYRPVTIQQLIALPEITGKSHRGF